MPVGVVLGAGGTVGLSYHAGVLHALKEVGGFDAATADLIVGTSAGSVVGAYLRSGWTTTDLWDMAMGTHPILAGLSPAEVDARRAELFTPTFQNMPDLVRRGLGSAFVIGRTLFRVPAPVAPALLRRVFPGGLFDMTEGSRRFTEDLPVGWPARPLWLCAVDIDTGRRVVLGRPGRRSVDATLHEAVTASCAIPGFYRPARVGGHTLVDGGAHSSSNLDLAADARCEVIVGIVPMAWERPGVPCGVGQVARQLASRRLAGEVVEARRRGATVLLARPTPAEVRAHGLNLMRRSGWQGIAVAAYDATARRVEGPRFRDGLAQAARAT
jgi:NTE family protein